MRLRGERVIGSGLELDGELIQLSAFRSEEVGAGRSGASPGRARGADVCALPSAAYAASSVSSPTSIGFRSGSLLHSNQPPSYTATFSQPMRSA